MTIEQDLLNTAAVTTAAYQNGMAEGARHERVKFEAVIIAYDRALRDKSLNVPTYLHMALENARSELAKQNIAAEAGIRKDQMERHTGRPEHDRDVFGARLEFGS